MERQRQGEGSSYSNRKKLTKREQQLDPMEKAKAVARCNGKKQTR